MMRIGIITLPLHTNYGGLLQAYALQTVLERMGHEVEVLSYRHTLPGWKKPLAYAKRALCKCLIDRQTKVFRERDRERTYAVISRFTEPFVTRYIHKRTVRDFAGIKEGEFDAFVVGSDQIWRPLYVSFNLEDAYLRFARRWPVRRVAYAASFGTDSWEYTPRQTGRCARLLSRFDAVGVRESSGVTLCREHFGAAALHVPDPTLLLSPADYGQLIAQGDTHPVSGSLLCYVLDENPEKAALIDRLSQREGLTPFRANSRVEDKNAPLEERIQPPVEQWLRSFRDARMVVTDSFHACVFSILFHKPFVVVGNRRRGLARMESLLAMFGLEDCLCFEDSPCPDLKGIDWNRVDERLEEWREKAGNVLVGFK